MTSSFVIDPSLSGCSGDMFVSALFALLENRQSLLQRVITSIQEICPSLKVKFEFVQRKGLRALHTIVTYDPQQRFTPQALLDIVPKYIGALNGSKKAINYGNNVVTQLLDAEAQVHGVESTKVHLHETGTVDTVFDIVAAATAMDQLGFFNDNTVIWCLPIRTGGGTVNTSHGLLPVPAPATAEIIKTNRLVVKGGPEPKELLTPTGAALLAALSPSFVQFHPPIQINSIGIGTGTLELEKAANILRIFQGISSTSPSDEVVMLETNVDDVSPEILGNSFEILLTAGALDVSITPCISKKNRPAYIVRVLCPQELQDTMIAKIMREYGTLGVRVAPGCRKTAERVERSISLQFPNNMKFTVRVKISEYMGNIIDVKPEFEDLKEISLSTNKSLRMVVDHVRYILQRDYPEFYH